METDSLHVTRHGPANAPPVIFVHAFGTDGRFWDETVADLERDHLCLVPDLRHAGRSPGPGHPVLPGAHAADLRALAAGVGRPVVFVGCAIGGMLAALAASGAPELAAGVVMANPGLRNAPAHRPVLEARVALVREAGMAALLPGAANRAFHGLPRDERYARYVERFAAQDPERYALSILGFLSIDASGALGRLRCPLLLVPGGTDVLMDLADLPRIQALVPGAETAPVPDGAHFVPFQVPGRFCAAVRPFLRRCFAHC